MHRNASFSVIDPDTFRAYREALYRVDGPLAFTMRIDEPSAALRSAHARMAVRCSAFISASNPQGRLLTPDENAARDADLLARLAALGFRCWPGIGIDPAGEWPGEVSALIFGIAADQARELGRRYAQNAIVQAEADAVPRLILLR